MTTYGTPRPDLTPASTHAEGRTPVTVLGLGLMGGALARALVRAGHPTTVWNRTTAKADELAAEGAARAGSVADAVAAGTLVVVCLSDHDAVREVLEPLDGALADRVVVNLTSGTSAQAREAAGWIERAGGTYLHGAIMAAPADIATTAAMIVYSGPRPAFDRHEPILRSLAEPAHVGADHGLSSLHEVAVLSLMWSVLNGALHATAMLGAAGVAATTFAPVARRGIETVTGWLDGFAQQIDAGDYPGDEATIATHRATMDHVIEESEALGIASELPRLARALADGAIAEGRGGDGYAAIVEQFRVAPRR